MSSIPQSITRLPNYPITRLRLTMRHTKIVATIGPTSDNDAMLDAIVAAGVDVIRLNFSHGTHETHERTYRRVRAAAQRAGRRGGGSAGSRRPQDSDRAPGGRPADRAARRRTADDRHRRRHRRPGPRLHDVRWPCARACTQGRSPPARRRGDRVARRRRRGRRHYDRRRRRRAARRAQGHLGARRRPAGVGDHARRMPTTCVSACRSASISWPSASCRSAADLRRAREITVEAGVPDVPLVAKLERPRALERLDEILDACQAVMVARGDLGLEMPLERVPRAQKEITARARRRGMPVILATQVLESMTVGGQADPRRSERRRQRGRRRGRRDHARRARRRSAPSRRAPCRRWMRSSAMPRKASAPAPRLRRHSRCLARPASATTRPRSARRRSRSPSGPAPQVIVAVTRGGGTARRLSALRPHAPILATTDREETRPAPVAALGRASPFTPTSPRRAKPPGRSGRSS